MNSHDQHETTAPEIASDFAEAGSKLFEAALLNLPEEEAEIVKACVNEGSIGFSVSLSAAAVGSGYSSRIFINLIDFAADGRDKIKRICEIIPHVCQLKH